MNAAFQARPIFFGNMRAPSGSILNRGVWAAAALLALAAASAFAQDYSIQWSTIDGGGSTSASGGNYTLSSTIGQPDAGNASGGDYQIQGGFQPGLDVEPPPTPTPSPTPTPPPLADSDGDGYDDYYESTHGSNPSDPQSRPSLGDANGDGKLTAADALIIARIVSGKMQRLNQNDLDMDSNGVINEQDAIIAYRWAIQQPGYAIIPKRAQ